MPANFRARAGAVTAPWLDYRVRWRSGDAKPGRHAARNAGTGGALRGYKPFWQLPDVRHIDVRRSLLDPSGGPVVRQMENRGSLSLIIAADVSCSMRPRADAGALGDVAALVEAAAFSAHRSGDRFGFIGFDSGLGAEWHAPAARGRGPALDIARRLRLFAPAGRSAAGLAALHTLLPARRCLVLLVSDFLVPLDLLDAALLSLGRLDVAPIMLHDAREAALPRYGLVRLKDSETGVPRLLWMRPNLQARLAKAARARRAQLDAVFLRHCRPAFHAVGALDLAALGQHLLNS